MKKANVNPHRSRFRRVLILLTVIAAFSLIFCLSIVYYLFFSDLFRKSETLIIPDLTGIVLEDPLPHELAGFQTVRIACYNDAPAGTVLSQFPEAGSKRKTVKGKRYVTLTLYVSKGQEIVPVPHLIGKNIENSTCELLARGFSYLYQERYDDAPRGTVIAQSAPEGTRLQKGELITLTVSLGERNPKLRIPSLSEYTLIEAKSLIEASGLRIGSITYHPTAENNGKVFSQFPLPGMRVPEGTAIALTVSRFAPSESDSHNGTQTAPSQKEDSAIESEPKQAVPESQVTPEETGFESLFDRLFERFERE